MPDTRITKAKLKNHLHYGKWVYILIAVVAWFAVDMVYTMTEYRPDRYHRVDVQLVGNSTLQDAALEQVAQAAVAAVAPRDPKLEQVNLYNIAYSGDASTDIYGAQKYTVILAEGSSSIFFVNRGLLENIVSQGGALPLDPYVESGTLPKNLAVTLPETDEDGKPTGETHVYAIDASGLGAMLSDDIGFDVRDKYALIFGACVNPDTAAAVLRSLFDQLTGPVPNSEFVRSLKEAAEAPAMPWQATSAPEATALPSAQPAAATPVD